jgi:hypothetical protein
MARQIHKEQESSKEAFLSNRSIAELLAREAETARRPLQRGFRRAARRAFLWPDEAARLVRDRRSLTELPAIGPYLEKIIRRWIEEPPLVSSPPEIRSGFHIPHKRLLFPMVVISKSAQTAERAHRPFALVFEVRPVEGCNVRRSNVVAMTMTTACGSRCSV